MLSKKAHALLGASALAMAAANVAAPANAQTIINGGGATLIAPILRQANDCWGERVPLYVRNAAPVTTIADFNYPGSATTAAYNCANSPTLTPNKVANYVSTGSGRGLGSIFSHDPAQWADIDSTVPGSQTFSSVQYALSDAGLDSAAVAIYNGGGTLTVGNNVQVAAPGGGTATGPVYFNPREKYGPLIQVPAVVAPVVIAYDPVYKKTVQNGQVISYTFNVRTAFVRADGSGGIGLDAPTYCKIFNGQITNWNHPDIRFLNGNLRLRDLDDTSVTNAQWDAPGGGVPLQIVGRSDGSGTTSIWTRHLAAVCAATPSNAYTVGSTTLPAALIGATFPNSAADNSPVAGETLGRYTIAQGNEGVSRYLDFTRNPDVNVPGATIVQGRLGYLGPDYALPYAVSTNNNAYGLNTASLKNAAGVFRAASVGTVNAAFAVVAPPQSTSNGEYLATGVGNRADPSQWVEGLSPTSPLANPAGSAAYPIVGTSNMLLYTCYLGVNRYSAMYSFLKFYFTNPIVYEANVGLFSDAGFAPLPARWRNAIFKTFVGGNASNASGTIDLEIAKAGTGAGANNAACQVPGIVGA